MIKDYLEFTHFQQINLLKMSKLRNLSSAFSF